MNYTLFVLGAPNSGGSARQAAAFARAALARGHTLHRVFFMASGTGNGLANLTYPQDESSPLSDWLALQAECDVELALCISSALKHGVLDEQETTRYEKTAASMHSAFTLAGLGQLIDAWNHSDRVVTFGAPHG